MVDGYKNLLRDADGKSGSFTLAEIMTAWRPIVIGSACRWLLDFEDRYLKLELS